MLQGRIPDPFEKDLNDACSLSLCIVYMLNALLIILSALNRCRSLARGRSDQTACS